MSMLSSRARWGMTLSAALTALLVQPAPAQLRTQVVANGLIQPVAVGAPTGDLARLFIVEQNGRIRILNLTTGTLQATPYITLSSLVVFGGEQGLLGMAFDPNFSANGRFYVNYTRLADGATVIARYTANAPFATSTTADAASALILKVIPQDFANHNGGNLAFGPDGMLYIGMGDGGNGGDPLGRSQNDASLLGKMLRLDVNDTSAADGDDLYIPDNNPFRGAGGPLDEIWAKGMRNPWRFSFDRLNGNLWIGDVGQDAHEEIDFQPAVQLSTPGNGNSTIVNAAAVAGRNYGWRCMEGTSCTGLSGCICNATTLTMPVLDISHAAGVCSITGGVVYRGTAIPEIYGQYFYADYCADWVRSFPATGTTPTSGQITDWTSQLSGATSISSFGEDARGEMYIVTLTGSVLRVVSANACGCPCVTTPQDVQIFAYNFQSDAGWAPSAPTGGAATDGLWQRGVPVNDAGNADDPQTDSDGSGSCWVTENAAITGGNPGSDVDAGTTLLLSPALDLVNAGGGTPGGNITICYDYYCNLQLPASGDGLFCEVSSNGTTGPWFRVGRHTSNNNGAWTPFAITAADLTAAGVTITSNMRVRFAAVDVGTDSVVECGVDNFKILRRIPIVDCNNNGVADATDISSGTSQDCNANTVPDECDIAGGTSEDYDGGPTGVRTAGDTFFNTSCVGCHGPNGTGATGPNIRNKNRTTIRNRLKLIVPHPGGGFPLATDQDFANIEAFLADAGSRGRPDRIPDSCQPGLPNCDNAGGNDGKELELGTQVDLNYDGVPDSCACVADVDDGSGTGAPDGGVTIDDLIYYLVLFEAGNVDADVDDGTGTGTPDGGVTIDDLIYYLTRFEAGC